MSNPNHLKLAQQILELGPEGAMEVFRHVFDDWKGHEGTKNSGWFSETQYYVGSATRSTDESGKLEPWEFSAVAYPDTVEYNGDVGPRWSFCQESKCSDCSIQLFSNAKKGFCPICFLKVGLT